jgi:ribosomal protein S18 acetylase RimI-like enzyme
MLRLAPPLRPAGEADAAVLAVLINEASHGLALHAWTRTAEPGGDPWAIGIALQAERAREGLWTVVDEGGGPVAGLQVWPPGGGGPSSARSPTTAPFLALRALAPGTLYVNVVATLPEARGRGFGTRLMRLAEEVAAASGLPGLSLIVSDANPAARRLYARLGYAERASRPMVKDGWDGPGEEWLLMVKPLGDRRAQSGASM